MRARVRRACDRGVTRIFVTGPSHFERGSVVIDRKLLDILACPGCKGPLTYEADRDALVCEACRLRFRIEDDIPIMLLEEAEKIEE
jgi:uncharacterized protein YbaR (Trm112 family)